MPTSPFNPPEDQLDTVLETLADPDHSLRSAAELLNTTVTALSLFLLQPEISTRLSIHNQAAAVKARLNACAALPDTATALRHAVNEYTHESLNAPYQLSSPRAVELRRRSRETMRKAASLLLRLATFDPTRQPRPRTQRPNPNPIPDATPVALHRPVPPPSPLDDLLNGPTPSAQPESPRQAPDSPSEPEPPAEPTRAHTRTPPPLSRGIPAPLPVVLSTG